MRAVHAPGAAKWGCTGLGSRRLHVGVAAAIRDAPDTPSEPEAQDPANRFAPSDPRQIMRQTRPWPAGLAPHERATTREVITRISCAPMIRSCGALCDPGRGEGYDRLLLLTRAVG